MIVLAKFSFVMSANERVLPKPAFLTAAALENWSPKKGIVNIGFPQCAASEVLNIPP
jgi:hypothetical protein